MPKLFRGVWWLACTPLAGCGPGSGPGNGAEPARAVVLITCDTLRADRLGLYGYARATSPNLDALAREAQVYDSAWSTAPVTGPAIAALLTGRTPEELGLPDNRYVQAEEVTTLAETLSAAGIDTAAVVSNWVLRRRSAGGVHEGFAHYDDHMDSIEAGRPQVQERLAPGTTDAALGWLDGRARAERPFFLWVHYQDPHGPYAPPAEWLAELARPPGDEPALAVGRDHRGKGELPQYQVIDDERRPEAYRARYDAEIRFFDRELGRLLDGLRARGILERALLVFTADHGEALGEHGYYFAHGQSLHRELLRVPLLVRLPGAARAGERVRAPVSHLDFCPSVLAWFGLEGGPAHGLDLLAAAPPAERILPQYRKGAWGATSASHRLLVEKDRPQLYDLERDPREEHDRAAAQPELVRQLSQALRAFTNRPDMPRVPRAQRASDPAEEHALDQLGYGGGGDEDEDDDDDEGN